MAILNLGGSHAARGISKEMCFQRRCKTTKVLCVLMESLRLDRYVQTGKKASNLGKLGELPRLSYTNVTEQVMVTWGKQLKKREKAHPASPEILLFIKRNYIKNYDTPSHYCFCRKSLKLLQTWSCLFPCGIKLGNEKDRHIVQSFQDWQSVRGSASFQSAS